MKSNGFTKIEFLVVVLISVILIAVLVPALMQIRDPNGPNGRMIPVTAPREENRFTYPARPSIILPPNWEIKHGKEWAKFHSLLIWPRCGLRRRPSYLSIWIDSTPHENEDLSEFKQVNIQGFPAYERLIVTSKGSFDDPAQSIYDLYIDRDGEWWHVSFMVSDEIIKLPPIMREYINTIRFPPKANEESES